MKRLILILSLICLTIPGLAEQISRDQALRKAQQFLSQKGLPSSVKAAETELSRRRAQGIPQPDYYYVFNNGQNQGFVIVSGDDRAETVLGYATSGRFDVDNIPSNMAAWLQGYADQIKYIQEHPAQSAQKQTARRAFPAISKLMTCQWDQDDPFNAECPTVGTKKCVTGCVTTAVSQILYYHAKTSGYTPSSTAIPGYTTESRGDKMPDLPAASFDWGNMIDVYNSSATAEQKAAVAKLFQYVGTGLKAAYNLSENGGTSVWDNMPEIVFKDYFGYGNGIQLVRRADAIPESEWDNLICNELANGRPVLYSGQGSAGGHTFVIDGYDGAGKYAINWGWGGYQDNYFALSALNPELGGAGAGGGGFNYKQTALVGISPNNVDIYTITVEETPALSAVGICVADPSVNLGESGINPDNYTEYTGTRDGSGNIGLAVRFSYGVNLYNDYQFNVGFALMKDGAVVGDYQNLRNVNIGGGNYSFNISGPMGFGAGLPNGDYQLKLAYKLNSDSEWKLCVDADSHILNVRVTDTNITLKVGALAPTPEVSQAELDALAALYEAQRIAINDKRTALASNDAKLTAISTSLSQKNTEALKAQITAIEEKLKNEYLTADQKKSYTDELDALKTKLDALVSECTAANTELSSLQAKSASLMSTLNNLLATLLTEAEKVSSITTKAALETSQTKVADIAKDQSACDVSAETTKVAALETTVATISATEVETGLTTLESTVDAAIKAAKDAIEEENKKQLETEKNALVETCDQLLSALSAKQEIVASNEKKILDLEAAISQAMDAVEPVEKKIAAIKESLKSDMLTAEQKTAFEGTLETLEKTKATYADAVKTLSNQLKDVKDANDVFKTALNEIKTKIDDLKTAVKAVTTTDALNNAKEATDAVKTQLQEISETDVEKDVLTLQAELEKLSLDSTTKDLAALEDDVDKAIAGGQEAYEKLQAEKLAKAQEEFAAAIDALETAIKSEEADYEKCLAAVTNLKAKLVEINEAIAQFKDKYAEIEKNLQALIDKQTRADNSEIIEGLQKKLAELKENIELLESQSATIAGYIEKLEQQAQGYAAVIEEAKTAKQELQNSLSSATTADEVDKLTTSATKAKSELASEGVDWYNLLAGNYNTAATYVEGVIDNVNIVDRKTDNLDKEVQETLTGISQVVIDESEVVARYDMKGNPVDSTYKGMQIIRLKNGKTIKLNVK